MSQLLLAAEALLSDASTQEQRTQASNFLKSQTSYPSTLKEILQIVNARVPDIAQRQESPVDVVVVVYFRQVLFANWLEADDAFRSNGNRQPYRNWLELVCEAQRLCRRLVAGSKAKFTPCQNTASQILALILKKGFALPSLWKTSPSEGENEFSRVCISWFDEELQKVFLVSPSPQVMDLQTQFSNILVDFLAECSSTENIPALGISSKSHLSVKTLLEKTLLPKLSIYVANELHSLIQSNSQEVLTATDENLMGIHLLNRLKVLQAVLDWSPRYSGRESTTDPHRSILLSGARAALMLVPGGKFGLQPRSEVRLIDSQEVPRSGNLFDTVCTLDSNLATRSPALGTPIRALLLQLASIRISQNHSIFVSEAGRDFRTQDRRLLVAQSLFFPLLEHLITKANECTDRIRAQGRVSFDVLVAADAYMEAVQALFYNPDCVLSEILAPKRDSGILCAGLSFNLQLVQFYLKTLMLVLEIGQTPSDLTDDVLGFFELTLSTFAFICHNISATCMHSEWQQYASLVEPFIAEVLGKYWRILEADTSEDLENQNEKEELQIDHEGQTSLHEVLSSRTFDLEDSKTFSRIGYFGEICRFSPVFSMELIFNELKEIAQNANTTSSRLDFLRLLFFLATAIMTDEPRVRESPVAANYFHLSCGQFGKTKGVIPWPLRRQAVSRNDEALAVFFRYLLTSSDVLLPRISPVVLEALLVFSIRVGLTYSLFPVAGSPIANETPTILFPVLTSASSPALEFMLQLCLFCLANLPSEHQIIKHALLGLRGAADLDCALQPHLWDVPIVSAAVGSVLADPLNSSLLRNLTPRHKSRLMAIFTVMTCPSHHFPDFPTDRDDPDAINRILSACYKRQNELLTACESLKMFNEAQFEEAQSITKICLLKGIVRGYVKLTTSQSRIKTDFRVVQKRAVHWLFSPSLDSFSPKGPFLNDMAWVRHVAQQTVNAPVELLSQLCGLLKAILDLVMSIENISDMERRALLEVTGGVLKVQMLRWEEVSRNQQSWMEEEKLAWMKNLLWLIQRFMASTVASSVCVSDEDIHMRRDSANQDLLQGSVIPFFKLMGETGFSLLDPDVPDQANAFITYFKCLGKCASAMPVFCVTFLSTESFVTSIVRLVSIAVNKAIAFRLEAEDLVCSLVFALTDVAVAAGSITPPEVHLWRRYLGEFFHFLINVSTTERMTTAKQHSIANLVACILLCFAPHSDALANLLKSTANEIVSVRPLVRVPLETHFDKFFTFAQQTLQTRTKGRANQLAIPNEMNDLSFRHQTLSHFHTDMFEDFIIDCRASEFGK